ncbi:MAG: hypothetical protein LBT94_03725, partial [Prevotellaceae bacterium]|nr:hypothetical protein [Prevotellaceae bacterium]
FCLSFSCRRCAKERMVICWEIGFAELRFLASLGMTAGIGVRRYGKKGGFETRPYTLHATNH